jgi:hypothetical protein
MTANPRTKIVTDYDVEKLADNYGRLHGCYLLPHQNACELCKRKAADFLASLPDAPTPEEKPMGFGYCPMCCHALNQCSHCDAPTEDPEPSHDFKPTEFGGDTCERCDKDVRSHLLPDARATHPRCLLPPSQEACSMAMSKRNTDCNTAIAEYLRGEALSADGGYEADARNVLRAAAEILLGKKIGDMYRVYFKVPMEDVRKLNDEELMQLRDGVRRGTVV